MVIEPLTEGYTNRLVVVTCYDVLDVYLSIRLSLYASLTTTNSSFICHEVKDVITPGELGMVSSPRR